MLHKRSFFTAGTVMILGALLISTSGISAISGLVIPTPTFTTGQTAFLDELAKDTWSYLSTRTSHHLPWSWWSPTKAGGDFANPAEIGLHMLSMVGAYEMKQTWQPPVATVETELTAILDQLRAWQSGSQAYQPHGPNAINGVFYAWYWVSWEPPVVGAGDANHVVPSIDNAILAASLLTIREWGEVNNEPIIAQKADTILQEMNFMLWYDTTLHQFRHVGVVEPFTGPYWDYYSNEGRLINFVARALGQLSAVEFQNSLDALAQLPATYTRPAPNAPITVQKVAWDGSYFTYTAPALFIREMPTPYGNSSIDSATLAQIAYAQDMGYAAWGLSDCFDLNGDYVQQGAMPTATGSSPETRPGLVTPHASALALITSYADEAMANLQFLATIAGAYDPNYGFRDSVQTIAPNYGAVSIVFSALSQEYILLSIASSQTDFIWRYLYRDAGVRTAHHDLFEIPLDTIGIYRPATNYFYLKNSNTGGFADIYVTLSGLGMNPSEYQDVPVVGDWNGDGVDTVGFYRRGRASDGAGAGQFVLSDSNVQANVAANYTFTLGIKDDTPIVGDWDGDGKDGVGVFRPSNGLIYIKNTMATGFADYVMVLGISGDTGIAGDWNNDGKDSPGVFRPSQVKYYLTNKVCNCSVIGDFESVLGIAGDQGFVGDWDGDGGTGTGVFRPSNGLTYLRNDPTTNGFADMSFVYGIPVDYAFSGNWSVIISGASSQLAPTFLP